MLIAQITDLHIRANRHLAYGRVDTATALTGGGACFGTGPGTRRYFGYR